MSSFFKGKIIYEITQSIDEITGRIIDYKKKSIAATLLDS